MAEPDSLSWTTEPAYINLIAGRTRGCRFTVDRVRCGRPIKAVLFRGNGWQSDPHRRYPFGYCEDHLYGRWIEDDRVLGWRRR